MKPKNKGDLPRRSYRAALAWGPRSALSHVASEMGTIDALTITKETTQCSFSSAPAYLDSTTPFVSAGRTAQVLQVCDTVNETDDMVRAVRDAIDESNTSGLPSLNYYSRW